MKRAISWLTRFMWGITRAALVTLPPLIVLAFGAFYVYQFLLFLSAPGVGFTFSYVGRASQVTLRTGTYSIDPFSLRIVATDVEVLDARGERMAFVDRAWVGKTFDSITADLSHAQVRLVRREDGTFDALDLLPPEDKTRKGMPFNIKADSVRLHYIDLAQPEQVRENIRIARLEVASSGAETVVSGSVNWQDALIGDVTFQTASHSRFGASLRGARADLVAIRPVLRRYLPENVVRQIDRWDARELNLSGDFSLDGNQKGITSLRGSLAWRGEGVRNSDFFTSATTYGTADLYDKVALVVGQAREPGRFASFDGAIDWSKGLTGQGQVQANLASAKEAWPVARRFVPKDIDARAIGFNGGVTWEKSQFFVTGRVIADSARAGTERIRNLAATVAANDQMISLELAHAEWRGAPLEGWISANYKSSQLTGSVHTEPDRLVRLEFPTSAGRISMAGRATALIRGTPQKPDLIASIDGTAQIKTEEKTLLLGDVEARITYEDGIARIERAVVSGPNGTGTVSGQINVAKNSMDVDVELGALRIAALAPDVGGVAYLKAKAVGALDAPQFVGDLTVLDVNAAGTVIPKITANARLQGNEILLSQIDVSAGLGQIGGTAGFNLKTRELSGFLSARDVAISNLVPDAPLVGRINADQIVLSGTASAPVVQFSGTASDVLVAGIPVDGVQYSGRASKSRILLDSLTAQVDEGSLTASGSVNLQGGAGFVELSAQNIPLNRLPLDPQDVDLRGSASMNAAAVIDPSGDWSGTGTVRISNAVANGFPIGSGAFDLEATDQMVFLSGGVSSLAGLLEIPNFTYGIKDHLIEGELLATNMGLREMIRGVSRQIKLPDLQAERIIRDLDGLVTAEVGIGGTTEDPMVEIRSLNASDLSSLGHALGRVQAEGLITANQINLTRLRWRTERLVAEGEDPSDSILGLSGTWTRGVAGQPDQIDVAGRLVRFDPSVLRLFAEDAPEVHASINADFNARGPVDSLQGQASLTAQDIQYRNAAGELFTIPVTLQTETIDFVDNILTTEAKLNYRGLQGDLAATVPLSAFDRVPRDSVNVELSLSNRSLRDLRDYVTGLDVDQSRGLISGRIGLVGQRGDFQVNGYASLRGTPDEPARLAFNDFDTVLENVEAELTGTNTGISLQGRGNGSRGGTVSATGTIDLQQFLAGNFTQSSISDIALNAQLMLDQFALRETIALANPGAGPGQPSVISADRPTSAVLNGQVNVTGSAARPVISGEVRAGDVDATIPLEFPESAGGQPGTVEPVLRDLRLVIAPGSKLNIPTGSLKIGGVASVNGSLSSLEIRAPFTVESGVLNLPASRVTLEQGTVNVSSGLGSSDTRAEVDLTGSTIVTLRQTSERYQTYRINLHIRGNLLDPEGILIEGSSDPPDLSQEEIRAIIGQKEFVESILQSAFGEGSRSDLRDSLYTLALPSLTQGLTSELARQLQLDYLVLDYNPFDGPVIRAGREISRGLMVEVSRQLYRQVQTVDASNRQPLKYEVQLSYRPPLRDPFLSRFRITAGFNEQVPWRIGISYSSRF